MAVSEYRERGNPMKLLKVRAALLPVILVAIAFFAGCTVKAEKTAMVQKKPSDSDKFKRCYDVTWAPDGKSIYTVESYVKKTVDGISKKTIETSDLRLYSEKTDLSDKKLLGRGLTTWPQTPIVVSPKGTYVIYTRGEVPDSFRLSAIGPQPPSEGRYLEIADVKTGKVLSKVSIVFVNESGWKDDKTAWYTTWSANGGVVTNTIRVGSSKGTKLVKGYGLTWSANKRYFFYQVPTVDVNNMQNENLFMLDTRTNTSSNILSLSGGSCGPVVLDGNNLYYVFHHQGPSPVDICVIDISTKTNKVLCGQNNPPTADNLARFVTVTRLFLDRSKKSLLFDLNKRELQTFVYKLPVDGKSQAQNVASMSGTMQENSMLDYCATNNSIVWIDKWKTIKTKRLD